MGQELLHVVTIVGTRPEIIRLSRVISRLNESKSIKHTLIHTGQNYDYNLNQVFFEELGIKKPDIFLEAAGRTATETIGNIIIKTEPILKKLNPDSLLVLGDTNSSSNDTISITAVGDIMLGTNYPNKSFLPPNDGVSSPSVIATTSPSILCPSFLIASSKMFCFSAKAVP